MMMLSFYLELWKVHRKETEGLGNQLGTPFLVHLWQPDLPSGVPAVWSCWTWWFFWFPDAQQGLPVNTLCIWLPMTTTEFQRGTLPLWLQDLDSGGVLGLPGCRHRLLDRFNWFEEVHNASFSLWAGPWEPENPSGAFDPIIQRGSLGSGRGAGRLCRKEGPGSTSRAQGAPAGLLGPFCHLLGGGAPTNLHPRCHCKEATAAMEPCPQESLPLLRRDTKDKASQTTLPCEDKVLTQTCEKV